MTTQSDPGTPHAGSRVVLDYEQATILKAQLLRERARIAADRTPYFELADRYTREFGFRVSPSNVYNACRLLGIHYRARSTPGRRTTGAPSRPRTDGLGGWTGAAPRSTGRPTGRPRIEPPQDALRRAVAGLEQVVAAQGEQIRVLNDKLNALAQDLGVEL